MKGRTRLSGIVMSAALLSGCVMNFGAKLYNDEQEIVRNSNSYNLVRAKQSVKGNHLFGTMDKLEGMGTIWKYNASEETDVTITYQMKISEGKAKLVLISPDDTVITIVECTAESDAEEDVSDTYSLEKGKNRIKLIGAENTKIEFEISLNKGHMISFGG